MTESTAGLTDEGELDPWVAAWLEANPARATPFDNFDPEILELARGPLGAPPSRDIAHVDDEEVAGVPVRVYRHDAPPTGLVVYFHGGGFVIGSIGLMDNVAREIAHAAGVAVVSVGYRLAPEHPYPAGLEDCEAVARWALANLDRFGVSARQVALAGESAGGNLAAAVSLRLREDPDIALAGQVLVYPGVSGSRSFPSRDHFDGLILNRASMAHYREAYTGGRDLDDDPGASPLAAPDLAGLPPALVLLGGCDLLRDEGRAYAGRLRDAGVAVEEICYPGQPHGFVNFDFPAAANAFADIGRWLRATLPAGA